MSSFAIKSTSTTSATIRITSTENVYYRVFCRLTSDTSSSVYDEMVGLIDADTYLDVSITGLSPGTSYTINVGYNSTGTISAVEAWLGAKTFTTSSTSAATTYYYRAYDETNSAYLTSSTSTTSSSIKRPTVSGYTYNGYKYNTSFTACINQSSYNGTGTTCSSHSASKPYVLFCYSENSSSSTTTFYYRCYDKTNGTYLTSSTSTTSTSITRPTQSGYTYLGYVYHNSWTNCINQSSYDGTGTTCSSHSASNPYVVFFYEPSGSSSSSPWSWKSLGSYTDSATISLSLSAGQLGHINFTPSISGTLQVYTEGSIDTYGWLTNGSCSLSTGNGSSALTGGTVYTKDDDSGTGNNFSYSYEVTAGTSYEIDVHAYSSSTAVSGTTLYIVLTPPSYIITCKDRKYSSSGTLLSTTTVGTATYTSGSTAKGSDWGTTSSYTGYYYSSCTTISSVSAASTVYRNYYPNSYTVTYNLNGGEGSIANTSRYYNEAYTLTTSQPTKQFYNFLGWGTSTSSTTALAPGATIAASTSTSTITYYALWEEAIKPMYVGINGTPHRVTSIYIGVNGVPKNVTIGYSGVSGVIKQIW